MNFHNLLILLEIFLIFFSLRDDSILVYAALQCSFEFFKNLIKYGADLNSTTPPYNVTSLMVSVEPCKICRNHSNIIKFNKIFHYFFHYFNRIKLNLNIIKLNNRI